MVQGRGGEDDHDDDNDDDNDDDDADADADDGVQVRMQMERGVVEGVELGQSYAVRVRARNAAGWSPWSIESEQLVCKHKVSTQHSHSPPNLTETFFSKTFF